MSDARAVIQALGLQAEAADRLTRAIMQDAPLGKDGGEAGTRLRLAVAAAGDPVLLHAALPALLASLDGADLSLHGEGVRAHLDGLVAWRIAEDLPRATHALNRSAALLAAARAPDAEAYAGRVHDTLGQMLHRQGLLADARQAFERALELKRAADDRAGTALTLGNLGRLCMALGDFPAASGHLEADLAHVEAHAPEASRLRSQLLTQIGVCYLEASDLARARSRLEAGRRLAEASGNSVGRAFAGVYLGRCALRGGERDEAAAHAGAVARLLSREPPTALGALRGLLAQLEARIEAGRGEVALALTHFEAAEALFATETHISPVEHAELLEDHAEACAAAGRVGEAARLLRRALRHLDATTAEAMRGRLDARLRTLDGSAWMLHSAGRFVGHGQIELLLSEAGQAGFRGRATEVVILFSDLRNFTRFSEGLAPETLIAVLNRYLAHMTRCVEHFGGMVDKFIGDAVMAVFCLPETHDDDTDRAVAAAHFMQAELERFNGTLGTEIGPLTAGIGLHHGRVVAGLIGSPQKRSYTVIGDAVNTASRLEGMTKRFGVDTLVTGEVVARLARPERWVLVPFGRFRPKGRRGAIEVFHLAAPDDGGADADAARARAAASAAAVRAFTAGDFAAAEAAFRALARDTGPTAGARGYAWLADEAAARRAAPPDPAWDGTLVLTEK